MKNIFIAILVSVVIVSCNTEVKQKNWQHIKTITVEGVNPIGIAQTDDGNIWLSDGDHNRLVQIDENGKIMKSIDSFERPMHIAAFENKLYIPEYGKDGITTVIQSNVVPMLLKDSLDAPAGVSVFNKEIAIADFYNNRILYSKDGITWIRFGKEGKAEGDFYYPTDVQITSDKIWVADAYKNRSQVFDKEGKFLKVIGAEQKMNAATGLYVSENSLFVSDFENDRVLVFDLEGNLKQELSEHIEKPTDLILIDGKLNTINYRNGQINVFEWKEITEPI